MDYEQRRQAMSELALPVLLNPKISTPRLEELLWFRIVVGEGMQDLHSQIHSAIINWPVEEAKKKSHASKILKNLISTGGFD